MLPSLSSYAHGMGNTWVRQTLGKVSMQSCVQGRLLAHCFREELRVVIILILIGIADKSIEKYVWSIIVQSFGLFPGKQTTLLVPN